MSKYYFRDMLSSCLYAVLLFSPLLSAEQLSLPSSDLIAPSIKMVPPNQAVSADSSQQISADVTDNRGVSSVTLFYRLVGKRVYRSVRMLARPNSSRYVSEKKINIKDSGIEYYIQAEDLAGNTVLNGQSFSPLVMTAKPTSLRKSAPATKSASSSPSNQEIRDTLKKASDKSSQSQWLWIGLGALAVGGLIAAGSDSGGGTPSTPTGTIVINAPAP